MLRSMFSTEIALLFPMIFHRLGPHFFSRDARKSWRYSVHKNNEKLLTTSRNFYGKVSKDAWLRVFARSFLSTFFCRSHDSFAIFILWRRTSKRPQRNQIAFTKIWLCRKLIQFHLPRILMTRQKIPGQSGMNRPISPSFSLISLVRLNSDHLHKYWSSHPQEESRLHVENQSKCNPNDGEISSAPDRIIPTQLNL